MSTSTWLQMSLVAALAACNPTVGSVIPGDTAQPQPTDPPIDECGAGEATPLISGPDFTGAGTYRICLGTGQNQDCPDPADAEPALREAMGPPTDPEFCWYQLSEVCGPVELGGDPCCYTAMVDILCEGRPLIGDGGARTAPLVRRDDWGCTAAPFGELTADQRAVAVAVWTDAAAAEQASIASFARTVLELTALGAPADLVRGALRAQADELDHASQAYGWLAELLGHPVGPGALVADDVAVRTTFEAVLHATIVEGCINETLSAAEVREAAVRCSHPGVAQALAAVADDERRHAALAWQTAAWILGQRPDLAPLARQLLRDAIEFHDVPVAPFSASDADHHRVGSLAPPVRADLRRQVRRTALREATHALLGPLDAVCAAA